jgi:two-component system, NtrC family, nitrogen regulation sensor histidine kinase NtrY
LIQKNAPLVMGESAESLGLESYLSGSVSSVIRATFRGGVGLWSVRLREFRQRGEPHQLLMISDITRALRDQELQAYQQLLRVLGHEINNTLAPIKSLSTSLLLLIEKDNMPDDWRQDLKAGLIVISKRCESLNRFTGAYARVGRLPSPQRRSISLREMVCRVARLEQRLPVHVATDPDVVISADPDQLEQLLINIIRNAADATLERDPKGHVWVACHRDAQRVQIVVDDEGAGLAPTANLFVPFFTTKPGGTGVGLLLCRQIVEAHSGSVVLKNRESGPGCRAVISFPV